MADVGNRHHQPPAAPFFLGKNGVVEILGRFPVNRHQWQIAQVASSVPIGFSDFGRQGAGFLDGFGRKFKRQLMLAQSDFDFHAGVGVIAEDFDNTADRLRMPRRLLDDFDHHHLACFGLEPFAGLLIGNDEDVLVNPPVFGRHQHDAVLDQHAPDDPAVGALGHFDNRRLAPPLAIDAGHAHQRPVPMQHLGHLLGIEKKIVAAIVRDEEAIAVRMPLDPPGNEAGAFRQDVRPLAVAHQLRLALHRRQTAHEWLALGLAHIEQVAKKIQTDRPALLGQRLHDVFAGGQRQVIFRHFTLEKRVVFSDF